MFLNGFSDSEKRAFLCFADNLILADGVITDEETAYRTALAQEVGLPPETTLLSEEESFKIAGNASEQVKKSIYMELLSLVKADTHGEPEEAYMKKVQSRLGLSGAYRAEAEVWLTDYLAIVQKGYSLIGD